MSLIIGYPYKFKVLAILFICLKSHGNLHFICENTQVKNGVIDSFATNQFISISKKKTFDQFQVYKHDKKSVYDKGLWIWNNKGKTYQINLRKLLKNLPQKDLAIKLRYLTSVDLDELEFSPIIVKKSIDSASFPKTMVETINPNLAVHQTWRLPKNIKAITSANYYIEYNEKYSMLTRIIQTLKSAFIKNTISCKRIQKNELTKIPQSISLDSPVDLTLHPEKWPRSLLPLKESIQKRLLDDYLSEKISLREFKKFSPYMKGASLTKSLIETKIKLEKFPIEKFDRLFLELSKNFKQEISPSSPSKVRRIFSNRERQGEVIIELPLDKTKKAYKKKSYIPNEYLDLTQIQKVSLYKKNKDYYFYFFSDKAISQIEVGPFKMQNLYWKPFLKSPSKCTETTMRHLNEYERKSFVFKRSKELPLNEELIFFERKNKRYPLNEMIITNNCRGTGNFEFEWPGIVKGYFQIPRSIMDKWYQNYNQSKETFDSIFVENRVSKFYEKRFNSSNYSPTLKDRAVSLWSKFFENDYRWYSLGSFDETTKDCSIKKINSDLLKSEQDFKRVPIKYEMGRIHYDQFPVETRLKSGYNRIKTPLVYIKTPCSDEDLKKKAPRQFYPPKPFYDSSSVKYWQKKPCKIAPINFFHYKDLLNYQVHLSKFEVDGVYVGQNRDTNPRTTTDYDQSLLENDKNRVLYNFKNVYSFEHAEISKSRDQKKLHIKLISKEKLNLILGNIDLSKLVESSTKEEFKSKFRPWATDKVKGIYKLIGIKPFDLSSNYSDQPKDLIETYALFYDKNGTVVNHHRTDIGIEQWFMRYRDEKIILDLISHERITPVARIEIDYKL